MVSTVTSARAPKSISRTSTSQYEVYMYTSIFARATPVLDALRIDSTPAATALPPTLGPSTTLDQLTGHREPPCPTRQYPASTVSRRGGASAARKPPRHVLLYSVSWLKQIQIYSLKMRKKSAKFSQMEA
ncbi:hypothetical protein KSP39_PZI014236 [Platanthera zijinensis]|uniref:Uncharacterized protein n=1 Tax=Platanthera zijinensis TaxID=2320716 RepID=A0AAP0BAX1_9ASPA